MHEPHRFALVCLAGLCTGAQAAAQVAPMGWLPELAGRCWNSTVYDSQVCYWQGAPHRLHFLSRSDGKWLDCGVLTATGDSKGELVSRSWNDVEPGETLHLVLSGDLLLMHEARPPYPEGVGRVTVMTRPSAQRFRIYRQGQYGADGRRAGQEQITASALEFRAGKRFVASDPDAVRCLELEPGHAQIP